MYQLLYICTYQLAIHSACAAVVNIRDREIYRASIIYKNAHRPGLIMPNKKLLFMCKARKSLHGFSRTIRSIDS